MKLRKDFLLNEKARIPFSVIGVFLILGSSFTATYVTRLERDKTAEVVSTLDFNEVEHILRYVEADISRTVSYSGSYALQQVGPNPVISSDPFPSSFAKDYADDDGDGTPDLDLSGNDLGDSVKFNINWIRNIIRVKLNEYLQENFMDDRCKYLEYIVNIIPEISDGTPVGNWRNITYNQISMKLNRNCGGIDDLMVTEDSKNYDTYWEFSVPLNIQLNNTLTGESRIFKINPTCIITSRLPIMFGLTNTFIKTINGEPNDIFANKLAVFIGLTGALYTEARALMMWSQGPSKIKNIVGNEWLKFLTNSGIVLEEFMVFNSVDAMSLIELARNVSDFTGDDKEGMKSSLCSAVKFDIDEIQEDMKKGILDEINSNLNPGDTNYTMDEVEDLLEEAKAAMQDNNMIKSIQQIAENILYEVDCSYYYHRVDSNNEPVDVSYNPCDPADAYTIILTQAEYEAKGEVISYSDPDDGAYNFILGKADVDGQNDTIIRNVKTDQISADLKAEAELQLTDIYNGYVSTDVDRFNYNNLGYEGGWTPDYAHGDKLVSTGVWNFISATPVGGSLNPGDTLPTGSYLEQWRVEFNRTDEFEICTHWDDVNDKCNSSVDETHILFENHLVKFTINPHYSDNNVDSVYINKNNIFNGEFPHTINRKDDNLRVVREEFPNYFVSDIRDNILESYSATSVADTNYNYGDGSNYKVEWIKAKDGAGDQGAVVEALEEILNMIINHEDEYSEASKEYDENSSSLDTMDAGRIILLNKFLGFRDDYAKEKIYHLNKDVNEKFTSIGTKTVFSMRQWYLDQIQAKLEKDNKDDFEDHIKDNIGGNDEQFDAHKQLQGAEGQQYKNALGDLDSIGSGQGIQIGLAMNLIRQGTNGYDSWSEDIAFALDRQPNYFYFKENGEWKFNIVNKCWGGPTGIPLLPIPPIPWFCTVNFWTIDIDGTYEKFKLVDTLDETHANPLFGHDGQIFERKNIEIYDYICSNGEKIGENIQISFKFWVPAFAIVPPNKLPIGDIVGGFEEKN